MEVAPAGDGARTTDGRDGAAAAAAPAPQALPCRFAGSAAEYFRIWIVNVCLTLLTLGVYSAWAKVRRNRYFYGSTRLDGSPFHYTANPLAILKGRLVVVPAFAGYLVTGYLAPGYELLFWAALLPALPWLVVRARSFALSNTVFRNVRFRFEAGYRNAASTFLLVPLLVFLSFGFAFPYFDYRRNRFLVERARYGTSAFGFGGRAGRFYLIYLLTGIVYGVVSVVLLTVVMQSVAATGAIAVDDGGGVAQPGMLVMASLWAATFVALLFAAAMLKALVTNYVLAHTTLDDLRFESHLNPLRLFWLYLGNTLAVLLSVGLLIPWAAVRTARYRAECVSVRAPAGLGRFVAGKHTRDGAAGEEAADFLDLDIGL